MEKMVEGAQKFLLQKIMGKRALRKKGGTWVIPAVGEVQEAVGTKLAST